MGKYNFAIKVLKDHLGEGSRSLEFLKNDSKDWHECAEQIDSLEEAIALLENPQNYVA